MPLDKLYIIVYDCMVKSVLSIPDDEWHAIYLDEEVHFVCPFCDKTEEELGTLHSDEKYDHVVQCYKNHANQKKR